MNCINITSSKQVISPPSLTDIQPTASQLMPQKLKGPSCCFTPIILHSSFLFLESMRVSRKYSLLFKIQSNWNTDTVLVTLNWYLKGSLKSRISMSIQQVWHPTWGVKWDPCHWRGGQEPVCHERWSCALSPSAQSWSSMLLPSPSTTHQCWVDAKTVPPFRCKL